VVEEEMPVARLGVLSALASGDTGLAYRLVLGLMDDGHPFPVILDEVLASIQWESGRRWEVGDYSISQEHASTAAVETLIALIGGAFDQPTNAKLVVVVCGEGDTHTLPARMATALLAYEGFRTIFLGTSLPAHDLREYLATTAPDALVVSCTRPANLPGARACIAAGHDADVPVAVGGRAFGDNAERATALGADARAPTLTALPRDPRELAARTGRRRAAGHRPGRHHDPPRIDPNVGRHADDAIPR
jgi:methanogenic corrinoid protein MtbC1